MISPYFMAKERALWYCRQPDDFLCAKLKEAQKILRESEERAEKCREMIRFLSHQIAERVERRVYRLNKEEQEEAKRRLYQMAQISAFVRDQYAE